MKIVVGSDHAGFSLKQEIVERVSHLGHEVQDLGAYNREPSDYPDLQRSSVRRSWLGRQSGGSLSAAPASASV